MRTTYASGRRCPEGRVRVVRCWCLTEGSRYDIGSMVSRGARGGRGERPACAEPRSFAALRMTNFLYTLVILRDPERSEGDRRSEALLRRLFSASSASSA